MVTVCDDCHQVRPPLNLIHQCHGCYRCEVHPKGSDALLGIGEDDE